MTNTAALMSPFFAGIVVARSPCRHTTASRSAPLRASSSTLPPPKQKPTAAFFDESPMPRFSASAIIVFSAALTRLRPSTRSLRTDIISSCECGGPSLVLPSPYMQATKATYLSPAILAARLTMVSFGAEPVRHHQQQRPLVADLVVPDQHAVPGDVAGLIFDCLCRHGFLQISNERNYCGITSPIIPASNLG